MAQKILIVEDEANIAQLLHLYLEKEGYETQIAADGGKAVELFRSFDPDLVLLDSLKQVTVNTVYKDGRPVSERFEGLRAAAVPEAMLHSVHFRDITAADLALPIHGPAHVIEMVPYQIVTRHAIEEVPVRDGLFAPDSVYTKLCVVERHGRSGGIAVCPLKGYGITGGAIATSVAHDSHNVIAAGDNDADLVLAVNHLK